MTLKSTPLCSLSCSRKGRQVGSLLYLLPVRAPPLLPLASLRPESNFCVIIQIRNHLFSLKGGRWQSGEAASPTRAARSLSETHNSVTSSWLSRERQSVNMENSSLLYLHKTEIHRNKSIISKSLLIKTISENIHIFEDLIKFVSMIKS